MARPLVEYIKTDNSSIEKVIKSCFGGTLLCRNLSVCTQFAKE